MAAPNVAEAVSDGQVIGFAPLPGKTQDAEQQLLGRHDHYQCWRKQDLPMQWHYGSHPRIPAIICQMDAGWDALWPKKYAYRMQQPPTTRGSHGYDPDPVSYTHLDVYKRQVHMRKVAQLAGISPMGIYRHFANRDALLQRLADDSFDEITRHWLALRSGSDVLAQLIALQRIYLDYALAHPHLFEHAFSSHRGNARRFPEDFHARRSPTLNVGHDAVVAAQAAGVLRAGEPWDLSLIHI